MPEAPAVKRAAAYIDGQNLYHSAREAFGHPYPNYDVSALAGRLCENQGWHLAQIRFYTGVPEAQDDPFWHHFWSAKLSVMGRQGVHVFARSLRYRNHAFKLPDGTIHTLLVAPCLRL